MRPARRGFWIGAGLVAAGVIVAASYLALARPGPDRGWGWGSGWGMGMHWGPGWSPGCSVYSPYNADRHINRPDEKLTPADVKEIRCDWPSLIQLSALSQELFIQAR
ncbi:MAG: hypothetical protein IMX00_09760 [Limnochordales bacterium]|nr:hypothetical protein [Limnochordales bacterium]